MKNSLLILFFCYVSSQLDHQLQKGVYGIYWDESTYTELKIIDEERYEYIHQGFVAGGYRCAGKYVIDNGTLKLLGRCKGERKYKFNGKLHRMPRGWTIKKDSLINTTEMSFPSSLGFKYNRE